ncbi:hypothetical protein D3C81_1714310 [compost metagenome]
MLGAGDFSHDSRRQAPAIALADRHAALQVGQAEVDGAVAAVGGAQQCKQRLVLVDSDDLTVAQGPAAGRVVEGKRQNSAHVNVHKVLILLIGCRRAASGIRLMLLPWHSVARSRHARA